MATDIQIFKNEQFGQIRVVERDGEPWFVAVDICGALDIANSRDALTRIDEDEKGVALTDTLGGAQEVAVVNEPGLYSLVLGSRKSEARAFKRWITHDVIPAIRKTGMYATPATVEAILANPDTMIQVLQAFKDEREQRLALETRVVADAPKVAFADAVETSTDSCLVGQLAKIIRQNGYEIGANRLFEYLRKEGYLCRAGSNRNMPTQRSMEAGWFEVKESVLENPDGSIRVVRTPKVTGKGQIYFVNKFLRPEAVRSESASGTREGTI